VNLKRVHVYVVFLLSCFDLVLGVCLQRPLAHKPVDLRLWSGPHATLDAHSLVRLVLDNARSLEQRGRYLVALGNARLVALELQEDVGHTLAELIYHHALVQASVRVLRLLKTQGTKERERDEKYVMS